MLILKKSEGKWREIVKGMITAQWTRRNFELFMRLNLGSDHKGLFVPESENSPQNKIVLITESDKRATVSFRRSSVSREHRAN